MKYRSLGMLILLLTGSALSAPIAAAPADQNKCKGARTLVRDKDTRDTLNAVRDLKKDGGAGVTKEAQAVLDQITDMFEKDDSRYSAEMAEAMREFAGGRATKRQAC